MTTVRELFTRLGFKVDNASLNKAEQGVNRVKDGAEKMATAVRNAALAFGGFAAVQGLVRVADTMQSLRARIDLLPQTIGDAGLAFDEVADRAIKARTSIEAYGTLYVRLAGATKDYLKTQGEVLMVTDAISNALVIGGAAASEAESATLQLSQAFQKGKLDGDEFKSFMENLSVDFKDKLSKELGTTTDGLYALSEQGKLSAKDLAGAFKRMAPEIEKQMLTIPLTWGQAVTIIENKWARAIDRINRKSMIITKMADTAIKAFDKMGEGIEGFIDKLGGMDNALRLTGAAIVAAFGAKAIAVLAAFRTASLAALWPYIRMAIVLTAVTLALEDLYVWIQGGDSVIGNALGPWTDYRDIVKDTWDKVKEFGPALATLAKFVGIATASFIAMEVALKVVRGAMLLWHGVVILATALQWAWNAAMAANPIGLIIVGIAALVAAGVWLVNNWQLVKDWFSGLFEWMASKFDWLLEKIRGLGAIAGLIPGLNFVAGGIAAYDAMQPGPAKMSSQGQGKSAGGSPTVNTTVNMQLAPGTTKEQQAAIRNAADMAFGKPSNALARDLSARGR